MEREFDGITIECVEGNIVEQTDIEAVVNAANAKLLPGGGVAGAIHSAAGPELKEECADLAPIEVGEAVITGAYNLPNSYVIHALGPVYGKDTPEHILLAKAYKNSLKIAEREGIKSIAFPAISTGAFSYPIRDAAEVALVSVIDFVFKLDSLERIRFVLYDRDDLQIFKEVLSRY